MATAITIGEYITTRSGGRFDPLDATTILLIGQAECELTFLCNESVSNKAIALLVMHWLTLEENGSQGSGSTGTASKLKEGDLSIEFMMSSNNNQGIDPYLGLTPYGLELWRLGRNCIITIGNRCVF
ncbi:MAG: DUF4054 domain-containing protein [Saprospiraceae bacterium]